MGKIASQITSLTIVYSAVYSDADQRKHQSSASLAFVPGIHRGPVNSPHKWPVTRKMFPFDDVIMTVSVATVLNTHPSVSMRFQNLISVISTDVNSRIRTEPHSLCIIYLYSFCSGKLNVYIGCWGSSVNDILWSIMERTDLRETWTNRIHNAFHYSDIIMGAMASPITSLAIVYSIVIQAHITENIKAPRHLPLWGEFTGDRWIPRANCQ